MFSKLDCTLVRRAYKKCKRKLKQTFSNRYLLQIDTLDNSYHENDDIMLHAMFQILVDYVEVENAHMFDICGGAKYFGSAKTPREKGIAYLLHEDTHEDENLTQHFIDVLSENKKIDKKAVELYKWWTDVRPARVDPFDNVPSIDFIRVKDDSTGLMSVSIDRSSPQYEDFHDRSELAWKLEEQYHKEDTEKLHELIEIRRSLWT